MCAETNLSNPCCWICISGNNIPLNNFIFQYRGSYKCAMSDPRKLNEKGDKTRSFKRPKWTEMMETSGVERPLGRTKEPEAAGISEEKLPRSKKITGKTQKNGKLVPKWKKIQ